MGQNQMLTPVQVAIDPVLQFGYPATCKVEVLNDPLTGGTIHKIISVTAPGVLYANAPYGSELLDLATPRIWYNVAGTWKYSALT